MKLKHTESEIIQLLNSSLDSVRKIVYFNENEDYMQYEDRRTFDVIKIYEQEIKKSYDIEKKISEYFLIPRKELNSEQIKIYDKYSDFMAYFPDIGNNTRAESNKINGTRYYRQYYFTKKSLITFEHSISKDINESDKIKLKYSACRCLRTLLSDGYGENDEELFDFRDFTKKGTIYYDANSFNKKFINLLTEKSEIFLFFLQINSGSGINLLTNEFMSRISMLNEKNIKKNLFSTVPKYGIIILTDSPFNAYTFNEVKITCLNEHSSLGRHLKKDDLLIENDPIYNRRYLLANLMQHEDFGHINFSINFYAFYDEMIERTSDIHYSENLSPFKYYMIKEKKEKIQEIVKEIKLKSLDYKDKKEENKENDGKKKEDTGKNKEDNEEDNKEEKKENNKKEKKEEDNEEKKKIIKKKRKKTLMKKIKKKLMKKIKKMIKKKTMKIIKKIKKKIKNMI